MDNPSIEDFLEERDRRYSERFDAQEKAVAAALAAAKEAVIKAELSADKRFEGVNEFRATLSDQASTFMPRGEAHAMMQRLDDKIDSESTRLQEKLDSTNGLLAALNNSVEKVAGTKQGLTDAWIIMLGALGGVGTLFGILAVVYAVTK